jgi:hypothetical protein
MRWAMYAAKKAALQNMFRRKVAGYYASKCPIGQRVGCESEQKVDMLSAEQQKVLKEKVDTH